MTRPDQGEASLAVGPLAWPLRIALVAPVAQSIPPARSGSIEAVTALLVGGLVARGHDVTLFATGSSRTPAKLHAIYDRGYDEDPSLWPWELCELFNLAAACERADSFDVIHYQARYSPMSLAFTRTSPTPILQTLHHLPTTSEVALWSAYPEAPFVAVSKGQARLLAGLTVVAIVHHAVDASAFAFSSHPDDYLVFLGRFTEGKGVLQAIEVARRTGMRLILAAAENEYYRDAVAPYVDQARILYVGEVDHAAKVALLGGARALLYPVQAGEPFGLVLAEAMVCGTPVAALDRGAVRELVDEGITGCVFDSVDALVAGLPRVLALDRGQVRGRALERFGPDRMVDAYVDAYSQLVLKERRQGVPGDREERRQGVPGDREERRQGAPGDREVRGRSLLAVFAHPDDEALACGGLLALCAHRGARVSLLCVTDGRHDQGKSFGELRAGELDAACRALGVADLVLLDYEDGMLPWVDQRQLEADIGRAIDRFRPDVVITFDEDGLYWHPDHIAIHERTTAAVAAAGVDGPALYYVTVPPGRMRAVVQHAREILVSRGQDRQSPLRILGIAEADAFGALAPAPTLIVDAADFAGVKLTAIRCHRSQLSDDALTFVSESDAARLLGVEHYRRAEVGSPGETFIDRLGSRCGSL